jgi:hypothetical protein
MADFNALEDSFSSRQGDTVNYLADLHSESGPKPDSIFETCFDALRDRAVFNVATDTVTQAKQRETCGAV